MGYYTDIQSQQLYNGMVPLTTNYYHQPMQHYSEGHDIWRSLALDRSNWRQLFKGKGAASISQLFWKRNYLKSLNEILKTDQQLQCLWPFFFLMAAKTDTNFTVLFLV